MSLRDLWLHFRESWRMAPDGRSLGPKRNENMKDDPPQEKPVAETPVLCQLTHVFTVCSG